MDEITRRDAMIKAAGVVAGIAGAAVVGAAVMPGAEAGSGAKADAAAPGRSTPLPAAPMPTIYLPHGGGPWPFVDLGFDRAELDHLATWLRALPTLPITPPRAVLVISAHWEESAPTVMTSARPPMLYDYYGFPPASYEITWPAPGDPTLAARVRELLSAAGFSTGEDPHRGFDHGTFVPLKLAWPAADIPTVQLSLKRGLDPAEHLAMGRALAPLRNEGVYLVGSGMSYHNMRGFGSAAGRAVAEAFDVWLQETAALPTAERDARLVAWAQAPSARLAHPREEHLLPLMVVAGAAGADRGTIAWSGSVLGVRVSGVRFG